MAQPVDSATPYSATDYTDFSDFPAGDFVSNNSIHSIALSLYRSTHPVRPSSRFIIEPRRGSFFGSPGLSRLGEAAKPGESLSPPRPRRGRHHHPHVTIISASRPHLLGMPKLSAQSAHPVAYLYRWQSHRLRQPV